MRSIAAHLARALINAAPVPRGKRLAANKLFPFLKQDVCRLAQISPRLAPNLRMMLKLDEYPEYMRWMLPDFDEVELMACRPYIPENGICVDAGANVGHWSLVFSHFVGPGGRVFAFEPFPPFFQRLEANISLNERRNVVATQCALGNEDGTVEFNVTHCHREWEDHSHGGSSIQVRCTTLSDFIEKNEIPRLDFVKMDIEGAELLALKGMERHFRKGWRPGFCLELHEFLCQGLGYSTLDIKNYLADWGYTGWVLQRGRLLAMEKNTTHALADAIFLPSGRQPAGNR